MANRKISEFTALTAPASGDTFAILDVDASGIEVNKKITYANVLGKAPDGSASAPAFSFNSDTNSGISGGSDTLVLSTGGTAAISVDSSQNVVLSANLTVSGTTTTIDTTTLTVKDKNIEIAKGNGNDAAVDGAGITIDSTDGDKTWNWVDSTDAWTSSEHIHLGDNKLLLLGTGSDLKIYHDGSNSSIQNATGKLYLFGGSNQVLIKAVNAENSLTVKPNGAIELYYDNALKLETLSNGVQVWGHLRIPDSDGTTDKLEIGNSQDLEIYHNGTNSHIDNHTGDLNIRGGGGDILLSPVDGEFAIYTIANGKVQLRYDNSTKLETSSTGITVTGEASLTGGAIHLGTADSSSGHINAYETMTFNIDSDNDDTNRYFAFYKNGVAGNGTELFKILEDNSVQIPNDTGKLQLGASQDLELYHSGSHSYIDRKAGGTGDIYMRLGTDNALISKTDGAVELYYDNSKKFETSSTGVTVTGNVVPAADSTHDLGTNGVRWNAIYGDTISGNFYGNGQNITVINASNLSSGTVNVARLGSGSSVTTKFLRGDNTWQTVSGTPEGTAILSTGESGASKYLREDGDGTCSWQAVPAAVGGATGVDFNDSVKVRFGTGNDSDIFHDGSNMYLTNTVGSIYIQGKAGENSLKATPDGAVEAYYDNVKKLETFSNGIRTTGTGNVQIRIGSTDAGGATLYLDGDSNGDFSGTDYSYVRHDTSGRLRYHCDNPADIGVHYFSAAHSGGTDTCAYMTGGGSVELYYDNSKKFETTSTGATVTGVATVSNGIIETAITIATNHTITTNYNAMSAGPVTVSATVTVPSGSVWTVI